MSAWAVTTGAGVTRGSCIRLAPFCQEGRTGSQSLIATPGMAKHNRGVISYLKSELQTQGWASQQHVIEAASRVFTEVGELGVLYKAIYKVITDRVGNLDPRQP